VVSEPTTEVIELSFPASSRFIRLSRLAAATLAAELDFDVEGTDDVRIAVDELVTLLVDGNHEAPVRLTFTLSADALSVEGECSGDGVAPIEPSDLIEAVLSAVADHHELSCRSGARSFSFRKRRGSADDGPVAGPTDLD